ncbi:MAG: DMT family transporter [Myxococcota bacterium]
MTTVWLLLALLAASFEPLVAKLGYTHGVPLESLFVGRCLVAALAVWPITRFRASVATKLPASPRDRRGVAFGGLLLATTSGLTLFALTRVPTSIVVVAVTTTPALVAAVNHMRGRERTGPLFWLGVAACVCGVLMTLELPGDANLDTLGVAACAAAVVSSCVYRLHLDALMTRVAPAVVSSWVMTVQGVCAVLVVGPLVRTFPPAAVVASLWTGVFAALANVAFLKAMQLVGATRVSIFTLLQRPLVIGVAALLLDEPMGLMQWLGTGLVIAGMLAARGLFSRPEQRAKPMPPCAISYSR